jgi:hypothetical protein
MDGTRMEWKEEDNRDIRQRRHAVHISWPVFALWQTMYHLFPTIQIKEIHCASNGCYTINVCGVTYRGIHRLL